MAHLLARTPATPNQVSVGAFLIALGSMAAYLAGVGYLGGIFAQVSSIVDGADGDLARLKGMTSAFGGFFDSILDRYADAAILLGLTYWAADGAVGVWSIGFTALAGTFAITYTRARIEAAPGRPFDSGLASAASRDVRLIIVMIGSIAGLGFHTLLAIAVLTNSVVALRIWRAKGVLAGL
jgi:phosphatidylglycerophosphate synthase